MKLALLILEDETEVRNAIERDLLPFADTIRIEPASDVDDAWEVVEEIDNDGDVLALALCDHRMPGTTGVEFLIQMMNDDRTAATRKVLVTGQAQLEDTVRAVNEAGLDHYVAKPWKVEELHAIVREQLTNYVEEMGIDPLPHYAALDSQRAMELSRDL
ncbi:response regulator [Corynebacterium cystitidis]|uniref:Response regulator receiver domain-containing protein n=1 Tax=Corynebacterium cystitidis DSM 20524 TaxID=1121357 RepID=A0A1H9U7L4_9CORY|nr:response regulator [Corynebacterium cystitidis]WJY81207.1 Hydrogenase transcriptional regulatory protein hupR1 [Corynebacterium cystitidis DSM 20524]SES05137.1 Response regulator receiver domain-containing protein [Corynebacterium cystitidis DSM 20524]SNV89422.1 Hydrogenase transcriptional regulatory protein hupR1 [Corynebacterium cystitidis]